ncbi:HalOD1 output domain-containing protein [Halobaculum litoreum]|uniref:HalOD1 output domain-containing protein n=1 Tax=Halobaculum litoreum TaxID=3031998 RepID=A0ABD5XWR5_9EURY
MVTAVSDLRGGDDTGGTEDSVRWRGDDWIASGRRRYVVDSDDELTTAIVFAVADARAVAPEEIGDPSLYDCVDIGALERLVSAQSSSDLARAESEVRFDYDGHLVAVHTDGRVIVYDPVE